MPVISVNHVSYLCVYVCVSWGRGLGVGEMELRIDSNIRIHFLYIMLFLIWHVYLYNLYIVTNVSCHNYVHYVCET